MRRIRSLVTLRTSSLFLGVYSGCSIFIVLLTHGVYNELYARALGGRVGVTILQSVYNGLPAAVITSLLVFLTTNGVNAWKARRPGRPGSLGGLVNASELFAIGAVVLYLSPYAFTLVNLGVMFITASVVGVSTFIFLYDWRLTEIRDLSLKLIDLQLMFKDSLQSVNLITWASIIFLTGVVVAGVNASTRNYPPGSTQATAWEGVLLLWMFLAIFVAIGIWFGWVTPNLGRIEEIRLELRKLDRRSRRARIR